MLMIIKTIMDWNKGFMPDPQKFFKQHLIKKEEEISYLKINSVHFGEVSTTVPAPFTAAVTIQKLIFWP